MNQNLIFRTASFDDLESIMEIIDDAKQTLKSRGIDQWQDGYPNRDSIIPDIENQVGTVACINDFIVAYAAIVWSGEPTYNDLREGQWLSDSDYVVVHRLCIRKGHTHHGYATGIMRHIEQAAKERNITSFKIDTHADNQQMRNMLQKSGFRYCGIVYYDHGRRLAYEKPL
jgi:Acetyltransferase (GNAT) family.